MAPGYLSYPFLINFSSLSLLLTSCLSLSPFFTSFIITFSGNVKFIAIERGTPIWSTSKFGSGDITLLALKSTLFPIKFPLIRPSFPFSLLVNVFIGIPFLRTLFELISLLIKPATLACKISKLLCIVVRVAPLSISFFSLLFAFSIWLYWRVKSSWDIKEENDTEGLIWGGQTAKFWIIIDFGFINVRLKPNNSRFLSAILSKILITSSGLIILSSVVLSLFDFWSFLIIFKLSTLYLICSVWHPFL